MRSRRRAGGPVQAGPCNARRQGVRYLEVRLAPQLHVSPSGAPPVRARPARPGTATTVLAHRRSQRSAAAQLIRNVRDVLKAVNRGLSRAREEENAREVVRSQRRRAALHHPTHEPARRCEPASFRHSTTASSPARCACSTSTFRPSIASASCARHRPLAAHARVAVPRRLCETHPGDSQEQLFGRASMSLAVDSVAARDQDQVPVVALDIAGEEKGYPAIWHQEAFDVRPPAPSRRLTSTHTDAACAVRAQELHAKDGARWRRLWARVHFPGHRLAARRAHRARLPPAQCIAACLS